MLAGAAGAALQAADASAAGTLAGDCWRRHCSSLTGLTGGPDNVVWSAPPRLW
jgi:hypothetical protein